MADNPFILKELGSYVYNNFLQLTSARQNLDKDKYDNFAALYGYQFTEWNTLGRYYVNYLALSQQRVKITVNKIRPIMQARTAFIVGESPEIHITSTSPETSDKEAAYIAHRVARADWQEHDVFGEVVKAWEWVKVCGLAFIRVYWDANAGEKIGKYNGKPVFEGQVNCQVLPSFSVVWDPLATKWSDCRYCITANIYPREMIEEIIKEIEGLDINALDKMPTPLPITELTRKLAEGINQIEDKDSKGRRRNFLILEYFEKPSIEHPDGRYAMVAGNQVIKSGVLEFGRFPIVLFADSTIAGSINCQTPVTEMRPLQEALNEYASLDLERSRMPDMYAMPAGGGFPTTIPRGRAFIIGTYRPGMGAPQFISGSSNRGDYVIKMQKYEEWMENIAGVSSIASRARPPYQMSGRMGYIVTESNRALLSNISYRFKRSVEELIRLRLLFINKYFVEERTMQYINEMDKAEIVRFKGNNIGNNWNVQVRLVEAISDPNIKAQRMLQLNQNQLIMAELMKDPAVFRKFLMNIDPELGHEFMGSENDVDVARGENEEIRQGGQPQIQPWHNDATHMQEHARQLNSDTIKTWPEERRKVLVMHYFLHERQQDIKALKEQQKQIAMLQAAQNQQAMQGRMNAPATPGVTPGPAPQTPIQSIDQALEAQTRTEFPGPEGAAGAYGAG